ncbi:MAG: outer membrane beta-barrel protein [Pseudomonadota bacterium]
MRKVPIFVFAVTISSLISSSAFSKDWKNFFQNKPAPEAQAVEKQIVVEEKVTIEKKATVKTKAKKKKHKPFIKKEKLITGAADNSALLPINHPQEIITTSSKNSSTKTEGHFIGIDLIMTEVRFNERYTRNTIKLPVNTQPAYSDYGYGGGLNYKYAINFNGFFIAPGAFYEHNKATVKGLKTDYLERVDIDDRYGLKADLGYDVTNNFAPYLTGGYSRIRYTTQNFRGNTNKISYLKDSNVGDWYYGAGFKIRLSNNIAMNAEYNRQSFLAKTEVINTVSYLSYFKTKLDIFKVGISYNF